MRIVFVFLVSVLLMAMASGQVRELPFQILDRGANSGVQEEGAKILRTARGFEEAMESIIGVEKAQRFIKSVDWENEWVVLVYGGAQPTGGFSVDVKRIVAIDRQKIEIEAKLKRPAPGQMVPQAFTTPYAMIKMRKEFAQIKVKID